MRRCGADGRPDTQLPPPKIQRSPSFRFTLRANARDSASETTEEDAAPALGLDDESDDVESTEHWPRHTEATPLVQPLSSQFRPIVPPMKDTMQTSKADGWLMTIVYALVNVSVSIPCLYGYSGIIYRAGVFQPALPELAKLVILSSAVHQLVFSAKSSLPFAIAQVQDAGLIFLSAMASRIAANTQSAKEAVATTVVCLSLATASLGLCVWAVGRFRLANVVTLIPMPVVAGYLAFIGFFCLAAGIGLACSKDISTWRDFGQLDLATDTVFVMPAIVSGAAMCVVSRYSTRWYSLPGVICAVPLLFYLVLWWREETLEQARISGWVAPVSPAESVFHVFLLFDFRAVKWSVIPKLITTWLSMTFLVVFASALDIVAVEMDLAGAELDIDKELETVGMSNFISGVFGGLTGSYIFSQTIFTRRTGTRRRTIGLMLAACEFALFAAPFSLMSYIPRFFFAATLIFIALDLMLEWLVTVGFRVSGREYALVLLTFGAITFTEDLVLGILIGTAGAVINFISLYSGIDPIVPATKSSNVLREFESRMMLTALAPSRIISARINGFLFFGSSTLLLYRVREFLAQAPPVDPPTFVEDVQVAAGNRPLTLLDAARRLSTVHSPSPPPPHAPRYGSVESSSSLPRPPPRRFFVLDFSHCSGLDATAVATGLTRIRMLTQTHNLGVVFTAVSPAFANIMHANNVLGPESGIVLADNLNDGLDFCETELLGEAKFEADRLFGARTREMQIKAPPVVNPGLWGSAMTLKAREAALQSAREDFCKLIEAFFGWQGAPSMSKEETEQLCSHFDVALLRKGDVVFDEGEPSDRIFVMLSGEVVLYRVTEAWRATSFSGRAFLARSNPKLIFGKEREIIQRGASSMCKRLT